MKRTRMLEFGVGLFILAGFLGMVFLGLRVSGVTFQQADDTFAEGSAVTSRPNLTILRPYQ